MPCESPSYHHATLDYTHSLNSVVGVSIARFTFIINLDLHSPDITWNFVNVQIWTGVESHIAITCGKTIVQLCLDVLLTWYQACLPSLRPILNLLLFGSVERSHRRRQSKPSSSEGSKARYLWNTPSKARTTGPKHGPVAIAGEEERGFIRLEDQMPNKSYQGVVPSTHGGPDHDSAIHVRTDFYVGTFEGEDSVRP